MSKILSIYGCCGWEPEDAWLHSAGASLWIDGQHKMSVSEERLTRIKHDGNYPKNAIKQCLDQFDLSSKHIDKIVYVENVHSFYRKHIIERVLKQEFPNAKVVFLNHHIAHASASFYTSKFDRATILTYDGAGSVFPTLHEQLIEVECGFFGIGYKNSNGIRIIDHFKNGVSEDNVFPLGSVYNEVSRFIYSKIEPEKARQMENPYIFMETAPGKVMGLSAYGDKDKVNLPESLFKVTEPPHPLRVVGNKKFQMKWLDDYEPEDLSAWLQSSFEDAVYNYLDSMFLINRESDSRNLVLGGGCALNVLLNTKLLKIFDDIHVFPAPNDSGLCFGGGIYESVKEVGTKNIEFPKNLSQLGKTYTTEDILKVVKS